ncbi:MAG TPA: T9SS type A sorting domain-containing protein [Chitinophagales bacterium]|nr:T9SS type A sorting domain-containing protein [Chitinophagales bacterium]
MVFLLLFFSINIQAKNCSQLQGNFGTSVLTKNIKTSTQSYKTTTDYTGNTIKLQSDIYQGVLPWNNDQMMHRPLLVLYHGGGFKAGSRNVGIMQFFANYFAQRGYVVVSADYRMGWEKSDKTILCGGGTQSDYLDAQYRAMQDERSLIQYYKSQSNTLKFDTNRIFIFGISSGATLVCSRLEDEWISQDNNRSERLGALEVFEGNRNYSTDVAGILSFAGANLSSQISSDYHTPIAFFHGTCDNAVPLDQQYLASCSNMGYYYGPNILSQSLDNHGVCYQKYIYCGYGHDLASIEDSNREIPWALENVFENSLNFMQSVMCSQCQTTTQITNQGVDIHPVADCSKMIYNDICGEILPSEKQKIELTPNLFHDDYTANIQSDFDQEKVMLLNIYNMNGVRIQTQQVIIPAGIHQQNVQLHLLDKGVYLFQFIDGKEIFASGKIWKM